VKLTKTQIDNIAQLNAGSFFEFASKDACFCCGSVDFKRLLDHDRYGFELHYVRCMGCGFIFANPYYTQDCLNIFYLEYYAGVYARQGSTESFFNGEYINAYESIWPLLRPYVRSIGTVLDYGCAHGGSLMAFPQTWKRIGYDYDIQSMAWGKQFGLDLRDIRQISACTDTCDVIMINQVLEHIINPIKLLKSLHYLLKDDGILYVEVPSLDAIAKSSAPLLAFKNAHRHFFCVESLRKIAEHAGFAILYAQEKVSRIDGKRGALRAVMVKNSTPIYKHESSTSKQNFLSANSWADRMERVLHHPRCSANFERLLWETIELPPRIMRKIKRKRLIHGLLWLRKL
jgi:SAM-dependent methyltransferase